MDPAATIQDDMNEFVDQIKDEPPNRKQLGIRGARVEERLQLLADTFLT